MRTLVVESEAGTDTRCESFIHQINATTTRIVHRIANRALLDGSGRARNTNDEMTEAKAVSHLAYKLAQHFLRDFEVENGAATNWPVHFDTARLAAQKLDCLVSHADDLAVVAVERYD